MLSGQVLDRFQLHAPLARGGMGELWLAADARASSSERPDVVLKMIRRDLVDDDEVRASFEREIRVTACLDHQNVVRHVAHGSWQGMDVLAVAHIEGISLAELAARGALPVGAAACVARDIAEALSYVHHVRAADGALLGVVHGDVSPQNVVVDVDGNAHLIDFGAVKLLDDPAGADIIGKPGYISPEQSRGAGVDGRSDQYSLGVVLWELVTGGDLFEGNAARRGRAIPPTASIGSIAHGDGAALRSLDAVLQRMLAFDADARFLDVADAGQAIAGIALDVEEQASRAWLAHAVRQPRSEEARAAAWRPTPRTVKI